MTAGRIARDGVTTQPMPLAVRTPLGVTLLDAGAKLTVLDGALVAEDMDGKFIGVFSPPWQVTG